MRVAALVVMLAACRGSDTDDYVIIPGGDDTPIGPQPDAARPDGGGGDGGGTLDGRVCLLLDPRDQGSCSAFGAGGLVVTIGSQAALTAADGSFTMPAPQGTNLVWHVTGDTIVTSVMPLSSTNIIPAIDLELYNDMLFTNGVLLDADQGSIFARIVQQGAAVPGALVSASPPPAVLTRYDGSSLLLWDEDATGPFGVAWITGAPVGTSTLTVVSPVGNAVTTTAPVEPLSITFVTVALP